MRSIDRSIMNKYIRTYASIHTSTCVYTKLDVYIVYKHLSNVHTHIHTLTAFELSKHRRRHPNAAAQANEHAERRLKAQWKMQKGERGFVTSRLPSISWQINTANKIRMPDGQSMTMLQEPNITSKLLTNTMTISVTICKSL